MHSGGRKEQTQRSSRIYREVNSLQGVHNCISSFNSWVKLRNQYGSLRKVWIPGSNFFQMFLQRGYKWVEAENNRQAGFWNLPIRLHCNRGVWIQRAKKQSIKYLCCRVRYLVNPTQNLGELYWRNFTVTNSCPVCRMVCSAAWKSKPNTVDGSFARPTPLAVVNVVSSVCFNCSKDISTCRWNVANNSWTVILPR